MSNEFTFPQKLRDDIRHGIILNGPVVVRPGNEWGLHEDGQYRLMGHRSYSPVLVPSWWGFEVLCKELDCSAPSWV